MLVGVWLGLAVGLLELPLLALKRWGFGLATFATPQGVWAVPLTYIVCLVPVAGLLALLGRRWRPIGTTQTIVLVVGFIGLYSAMKVFDAQVHEIAQWLLAGGGAVQAASVTARRPDGFARLTRRTVVWLVLLVAILGIGVNLLPVVAERRALAGLGPARAGAPNVLLLIWDTARAPSMSLYGHSRPTTPALERLAARGVVFERAISNSSFSNPSHASILTGRFPHEVSADWGTPLDETHPTLAEVLAGAGYRTGGFSANSHFVTREMGMARGFAHFQSHPVLSPTGTLAATWLGRQLVNGESPIARFLGVFDEPGRQRAGDIHGALLRWIDRMPADRPFFAMVNVADAHHPYLPPEPFASRFGAVRPRGVPERALRRLARLAGLRPESGQAVSWDDQELRGYEGALAYLDQAFEQLMGDLDRRGLLDRTVIILTSDHGEEFGEHAGRRHGRSLYWTAINVPLVLWLPTGKPAGLHVREPVSLRAIPATVAKLAELGSPFPGQPLTRAWDGSGGTNDLVLAELNRNPRTSPYARSPIAKGDMKAVVRGSLHYIRNGDGSEELYDLDADPRERDNLIGRVDEAAVAPLRAMIDTIPARKPVARRSLF
jgi:arylsulfatase A-like enzyme